MNRMKTLLSLFIVFLMMTPVLQARETGNIQGKIMDQNGEDLPGVVIVARGPNLQGLRSVLSSKNGTFRIPLLPVGSYVLSFELEGFTPLTQENVIVRLGQVTDLKIMMTLEKIKEEIVVTAKAPLIDKTSTDTSFHLNSADLERLPFQNRTVVDAIKFTPGVTGVRVNTRQGLAIEGQPSFRGEGEEGNTWIVDGLSISGVRLRNSGPRLNFDSIDEIQIISDSFSPEFGSAYGGIINMVTKSGGNEFEGELAMIFSDKRFQSELQDQLSAVDTPDRFSNYNWYLNLGGPLIKDKLWFFLSDNLFIDAKQTRDTAIDYFLVPGGQITTRNNSLFAKLTYAFNSNHNVSLTSTFHKSLGQEGGVGIPDLIDEKLFTDFTFRLNYKGILNASTLVEAGIGRVIRDSFIQPVDEDLGPAQYYIEDLARNIHNSYGKVTDDQKRLDLTFKLTKFFETDNFGRHELSLGFEYYSFSSEFGVDFTGKEEEIFPDDGFDSGTKIYFDTWQQGQRIPTRFFEYGTFNFINSSRGIGLYFKEKATWGRFTFMAGIRTQTQLNRDNQGEKLWSWNLSDFLSPRFSLAVDITNDGNNILKLGWGRFSDLITTMPLGLLNSGAGLTFRTYDWIGPPNPTAEDIHAPSNWEFKNEQKAQPFDIAEGVDPNFLTRYLVEYDRRLGRDWAFKIRYIRTKAEDLLEVLAVLDLEKGFAFLFDNFAPKRRNYQGLEFELYGKLGPRLFLNASYNYSSAKGTNPGQTETGSWSQEEGSTNYLGMFGNHIAIPDLPGLSELKQKYDTELVGLGGRGISDEENESWYGKLPYSVDNSVKLNIIYMAPYGISLTAAFEWLSGYYWEKLGFVPYFGGFYSFPEGRGTRKSPAHSYLDVGIEKEFTLQSLGLSKGLGLTLRLDMFNLLNSQEPVSFVKEDIPSFGDVWGRQQPRQARMMIRLKW